jgi:L-amino acid N-acyltransferase YncA
MVIRPADPSRDAAACAAIYGPYVTDTVISFEYEPPPAEEFRARIERYTSSHPWMIAELDGAPAGFAYASAHRDRTAYQWAADVAVYVARGQHRRGVGRALYGDLLGRLRDQGLYVACAGITLPNPGSVGLHRACGFTEIGVYRRVGFKFGAWRDVSWWQTQLREPGEESPAPPGAPQRSEG